MPVVNLSDVTSTLETLLSENIEARYEDAINVFTSSVAPAGVVANNHHINLFLFHFHPDGKQSAHENRAISPPRPASFSKPQILYYHLTAHHNANVDPHLVEQDLLGHAMATLMDHTEIDDTLTVGGVQVLDAALRDDENQFEIEVLSKTDTEALNVWAGHETADIKASLYFKVKNVRLQPMQPQSFAGPILSIGHMVVPNMGPQITSIRSAITANLPTEAGPVSRQFRRQPAEIYLGAIAADRAVTITGSSIDQFVGVDLTVPVGDASETLRVDFAANDGNGWTIAPAQSGIAITYGDVVERPVGGVPTNLPLEPGGAQIRLIKTEFLERDGEQHPVEVPSKPYAFTLHPHIAGIPPSGLRRFTINLNGDFDLQAMAGGSDHARLIRLAVGGIIYEVIDDLGALAAGQAAISGQRAVDFILTADADETALAMVQLWVRDAVSQPFWIGGA
ncbi:MAG: Pvc16 family protein [Pseudomonadota bacterium]